MKNCKETMLLICFILFVGIFQYKADKKKYNIISTTDINIEEAIDIIHHNFSGIYTKPIIRESLILLFNKYSIEKSLENYLDISNRLIEYRKVSKGMVKEMDIINDILLKPKIDTIQLKEAIEISYNNFINN